MGRLVNIEAKRLLKRLDQNMDEQGLSLEMRVAARRHLEQVMKARSQILDAWVAETGLLPHESRLIEQQIPMPDGTTRTAISVVPNYQARSCGSCSRCQDGRCTGWPGDEPVKPVNYCFRWKPQR